MKNFDMPAQVMRCPECGKIYTAEEGHCLSRYRPTATRSLLQRRQVDPDIVRVQRIVLRFFGVLVLLTGAALTVA